MHFKQGTHVYASDQQRVGTVDRVVLDPTRNEVEGLIIRRGWLFAEDRVVPVNLVASATEERVVLRQSAADLDTLPIFEETYYVPADGYDATNEAAPLYTYPPIGTAWWGYSSHVGAPPAEMEPDVMSRTEKHIPQGTIAVREGARVTSQEGDHIGNVEDVFTDEASNRATHLVISRGLLFKERKLIPANWIKVVSEDEVILTVKTRAIAGLPEYHPV